jgi:hypothetical protein
MSGNFDQSGFPSDDARKIDIACEQQRAQFVGRDFSVNGNYLGQVLRNLIGESFDVSAGSERDDAHALRC